MTVSAHLSACSAIEMASSGAPPRKTATASPTILRIWCSMKDCPTTHMRTHGWPCTAEAEQALFDLREVGCSKTSCPLMHLGASAAVLSKWQIRPCMVMQDQITAHDHPGLALHSSSGTA